jgi:hypothetical protein
MTELSARLHKLDLHPTLDAKGSLRLETEAGPKLVKRFYPESLREQAFILRRNIAGLCLHHRVQLFAWDDELYQLIDLDPALKPVEDPREALGITQLYTCSDHIAMLVPKLTIEDLIRSHHVNYQVVKGDGHPRAREIGLESFVDLFHSSTRELWPEDEGRFRSGLFHEDLQTTNILAGRGRLHLIDLDPIWHTYSVMNLAHFFAMEVIGKRRLGAFDGIREHLVAALEEESERDFDFFVLLALYRALLRRVFHKEIFAPSAPSDFTWYFQELGFNFYLRRVASRR